MIRAYLLVASVFLLVAYGYGAWQHSKGWDDGWSALVAKQEADAKSKLIGQMAQQKKDEIKAAEVDETGKAKTVIITNEVVRYVKNPDRTVCNFDADRVRIKSAAVDNAANIPGFDVYPVPPAAAK